jgi:glycosyltransferase involved in cell wall biosynthesis
MNITFGIISVGGNENRLKKIITSILEQNIKNFEIVIVGGNINKNKLQNLPQLKIINFNEKLKPKPWITRKKNLINENAKYDIVVFMHDYVYLNKNWYKGMVKFGTDWDVCMTVVKNNNGQRGTDWITARASDDFGVWNVRAPYTYDKTWKMYVSGTYWISKKNVLEKYPLDEKRLHGMLEDVEWSSRWNRILKYKMNPNSTVHCMINKSCPYPLWNSVNLNVKLCNRYSAKFQQDNPEYECGLEPGFDQRGKRLPYKRRMSTWYPHQIKMETPEWYKSK